jgi:hypothetical protein
MDNEDDMKPFDFFGYLKWNKRFGILGKLYKELKERFWKMESLDPYMEKVCNYKTLREEEMTLIDYREAGKWYYQEGKNCNMELVLTDDV